MSDRGPFAADPESGFERFYREVHADGGGERGHRPYRWQKRLLRQLIERPPAALQAPTGAGKTTLIEAFLFALAWQRHHGGRRTLPLRLFWVVDRRSVVDQVHRRARHVVDRINDASDTTPALHQVRAALAAETDGRPDGAALECQCWRGGTGLRPTTLRPDSVAVVCSTVDQVGSRLLFRGYGTSRAARPIDAALVGTDSLIVVDEAHIAQPFLETVGAVARAQAAAESHPSRPVRVLRMSATLGGEGDGGDDCLRLSEEELAEPSLARRLETEKRVRLARPGRTRVAGLIAAARELAGRAGLVGVVANTVGEARQVHAELSRDHEAWLLIGPNRSILRDAIVDAIPGRAARAEGGGPKLIVATQTIEVGVDLDFDALVTACAPLDALIQRLGRLDRAGELGEAEAVVVDSGEPCPVYGEATASTWALLREWAGDGVVRMGPRQIEALLAGLSPQRRAEVAGPRRRAPLLTPWQIEALSQTSEDPVPSPEIDLFLHGDETLPAAEVNVVWRGDLAIAGDSEPAPDWADRVLARPPHPGESIQLPVGTVKSWLRREAAGGRAGADPLADVESLPAAEARVAAARGVGAAPFVLVTPGQRAPRIEVRSCRDPAAVTPGATVVVPRSYGGCDEFGWIPGGAIQRDRNRPQDLGDLSAARPRLLFDLGWGSRPSRRADDALGRAIGEVRSVLQLSLGEVGEAELYEQLRPPLLEWLRESQTEPNAPGPCEGLRKRRLHLLGQIEAGATGTVKAIGGETGGALASRDAAFVLIPDVRSSEFGWERRAVPLGEHAANVAAQARRIAAAVCADRGIARAVEVAARYHDHGKLDPRFQRWMFAGEDPDPEQPRAKSGIAPKSSRSERARIAAGWPRGKRHESLSALLLARSSLASDGSLDAELACYLIAVHHGRNRPFLAAEDPDPTPTEVVADVEGERIAIRSSEALDWARHAAAFARLNQRYSPWGLASIETVLVQADWIASREEQAGGER